MTDLYEEQWSRSGGLSTIVFLIASIILFVAGPGFGTIFSIRGLAFIIIGMFVAAIVVGIPIYVLQRGISQVMFKSTAESFFRLSVRPIKTFDLTLMLIQVGITVLITGVAFNYFIL